MESRTIYNHPSVCRLRRARFHVFIICFSIVTTCPENRDGISQNINIPVCDFLVMLDFILLSMLTFQLNLPLSKIKVLNPVYCFRCELT